MGFLEHMDLFGGSPDLLPELMSQLVRRERQSDSRPECDSVGILGSVTEQDLPIVGK